MLLVTAIWIIVHYSIIFINPSKVYSSNKSILSRKNITAIGLVIYPIAMTQYQKLCLATF